MAKNLKRALSLILVVVMAFSCYSIVGFAYTGYDNDGTNSSLKVQMDAAVSGNSFNVDDEITVTVSLSHPTVEEKILGFEGVIAYDSSVLEYVSTEYVGFSYDTEYIYNGGAPFAVDASTLTRGYNGAALTKSAFCNLIGAPTYGAISAVALRGYNLTGISGTGEQVAILKFRATGAASSTGIGVVPSIVYGTDYGFFNCMATNENYDVLYSAAKVLTNDDLFEIVGSGETTYYDITFKWHGNETGTTVQVEKGKIPEAPAEVVTTYSDDTYNYTLSGWSPSIEAANSNATYTAQYTSTPKEADFTAYNAAVAAANAKKAESTEWDADLLAALDALLAQDTSGYNATNQADLDALAQSIVDATAALKLKEYTITFVWKVDGGLTTSTDVKVESGSTPVAPAGSTSSYTNGDYRYDFKEWSPAITAASADTTYTATYEDGVIASGADYTRLDAAIAAAQTAQSASEYAAKYTASARSAVTDKLQAAQAVDRNLGASQQQVVTDAAIALENAIAALENNIQTYTITFKYDTADGKKTDTDTVAYGSTPTAPTVQSYTVDGVSYRFSKWEPTIAAVTGDATYEAVFTTEALTYTVTWYVDNELVKTDDNLAYGATVTPYTLPSTVDGDYDLALSDWTPAVAAVTDNARYDATIIRTFVKATLDPLNEALAQVPDDLSIYTDESVAALNAKLTAAQAYDETTGRTKNDEIALLASEIIDIINNGLVLKGADYTEFDAAVAALEAEIAKTDKYTASSIATATTLLGNIKNNLNRDYDITKQSIVDAATADVKAITLTEQVDKSALEAKYADAATEAAKDIYTPDSLAELNTAMEAAQAIINDTDRTAEQVANAITALDNAINGLQRKADKETLINLITEARGMDSTVYSDLSGVNAAADAGQAVVDDPNASTEDVTNAIAAIQEAMANAPKYPADYTAYDAAVSALEAEIAKVEKYTPASISAAQSALDDIKTGLSRDLKIDQQSIVNDAETAVKAITLTERADLTPLNDAIAAAEAYNTTAYQPATVTAFNNAVKAVKDTTLTGNETAADIQALVDQVTAAYDLLKEQIPYDAVTNAIAALKEKDTSKYKEDSVAAYNAAIADAETALATLAANGDRTQAQVDELLATVNAIPNLLVFSGADYSGFNATKDTYAAFDKELLTDDYKAQIEALIASVKEEQDINYQDELDGIVAQINALLANPQYKISWDGETMWNGTTYDKFFANLKYVQVIDNENPSNVRIDVYLNHPADDLSGIQLATMFDGAKMRFDHADAVNGTVLSAKAAQAAFGASDYGCDAMGKTSIAKVLIEFTDTLAKKTGVEEKIATLYFTATAQGESYIRNVPYASNVYGGESNYAALLDTEYAEKYMHNDPITVSLDGEPIADTTGTVSGGLTLQNNSQEIVLTLTDNADTTKTYTKTLAGGTTAFTMEDVEAGTYTLTIKSAGSLGYTVLNVTVVADEDTAVGTYALLFGDVNEDGTIDSDDMGYILLTSNYLANATAAANPLADVDGSGKVDSDDMGYILLASNYLAKAANQVTTL